MTKVAAIQMTCSADDGENRKKAMVRIREAAETGARIILLPELFERHYFCKIQDSAWFSHACSWEDHPGRADFESLAEELEVVLPVSFFEKDGRAFFNSVAVIDADGSTLGVYRKTHIPQGPGYEEKFYFSPGNGGLKVWETRYGTIGVGICWDQWFPEAARTMALMGADFLFYPTAIGSEPDEPELDSVEHWMTVQRGHAGANMVPVIAANRIGREQQGPVELQFYGSSFIAGSRAELAAAAGRHEETIIYAEFDTEEIARDRAGWGLFRDRRPDCYNRTGEPLMYREMHGTTPKEAGYTMPPETGPHECCWMGWPVSPLAWRGRHEEAKSAVARLANTISEFEPVRLLVPEQLHGEAASLCGSNVELVAMDIDDGWLRDSGPTFVTNGAGRAAVVDWIFNGWGDMADMDWQKDRYVAGRLAEYLDLPVFRPQLVNEGGAIHMDGDGTVLCTRPTLLDPARNPNLNEAQVEKLLCACLGADRVLWLDEGYEQDETGGHIDIIASFVRPGRVMHLDCTDESDPNYRTFRKNIADLESMTDAAGRKLEVVKVPQPPAFYDGDRRLDLSYQNYYPANGAVVLPRFSVDEDETAAEIFQNEFPGRELVWFEDPHILFHGGGGIHCLTQQQPQI